MMNFKGFFFAIPASLSLANVSLLARAQLPVS